MCGETCHRSDQVKEKNQVRTFSVVLSTISNYDFNFQCYFRTTFSKIDILTQLTKTTQSFGFKRREPIVAATAQKPNKFKAAQIAVTAVQTKKKAKTKTNNKLEVDLQMEINPTIAHPPPSAKNRPKRNKSKDKSSSKAKVK
jgi:hypothetical protein